MSDHRRPMSDYSRPATEKRRTDAEVVEVSSDTDSPPNVVDLAISYHEKVQKMKRMNRKLEIKVEEQRQKVEDYKKKNWHVQEKLLKLKASDDDWEERGDKNEDDIEDLKEKIAHLEVQKMAKDVYLQELETHILLGMRQKLDEIAENAKKGQAVGSA